MLDNAAEAAIDPGDEEYICPPQWVRDPPLLPCPHGRSSWQMCPHCLGLNAGLMPLDEGARAIVETDRILEQYEVTMPAQGLGSCDKELAK